MPAHHHQPRPAVHLLLHLVSLLPRPRSERARRLLPFQLSVLGYTNPSVSATNHLFNVVAIPSGVYRYAREGRMVWPLTWCVVAGTLPGVLVGAFVRVRYLPDPRHFKLFAAAVLLYIGGRLIWDLLRKRAAEHGAASSESRFQDLVRGHRERSGAREASGEQPLPPVRVRRFSLSAIEYEFYGELFRVRTAGVLALSLVVGIVGGIYGIGGGAIMAPFFVSVLRLPVYTVAGAALTGTCVTSFAAVAFYSAMAPFYPATSVAPDWPLGLLFGLGGMAGMYLGARCQKYVPARHIKWLLGAVLTFTAASYVWGFFRG
ncbi:MAG: sulfite exporter TauE/SafE family protein [Deltaproteobacteria bacterium]|nr:sulfite exporter TauE/SafE family protein [Deltaproteobacteria bacterium]